MITEDLIDYIKSQRKKNILDTEITLKLAKAGWHSEDIKQGFEKLNPPVVKKAEPVITLPTPMVVPSISAINLVVPEIEAKKDMIQVVEPVKTVYQPIVPITPKIAIAPIEIPKPAPIKNIDPNINNETVSFVIPESVVKKAEPLITPVVQNPVEVKPLPTQVEPKLVLPTIESVSPVNTNPLINSVLPESAVLKTFSRDILAYNSSTEQEIPQDKKKKFIIILIIILALSLIGGLVFGMTSGYISLPFSFIKNHE